MKLIRRITIKWLKLIIYIMPKTWLDELKRYPALVALYSRQVQSSGLLASKLQNPRLARKAYKKYQKAQELQLRTLIDVAKLNKYSPKVLLICVPVYQTDDLARTIYSLKDQSLAFSQIIFWCLQKDKALLRSTLEKQSVQKFKVTSCLADFAKNRHYDVPFFVIYAGDQINPALSSIMSVLIEPETELAYVDTDLYSNKGIKHTPDFKPDWNPDLQLTNGYIQSGIWLSTIESFAESKIPLSPFSISLYLCHCYFNKQDRAVQHICSVLLSQPESDCRFSQSKDLFDTLFGQNFCQLYGIRENGPVFSLSWKIVDSPLVSIIIPTKNSAELVQNCIDSIIKKTTYINYEILLIDNASDESEAIKYFSKLSKHKKIRVLSYPYEFNYSAINNFAAKQAKGDVLALVNNDIEVISPDWLTHMVGHVNREDIGCVGAKLLYPNKRIQHAGVVMGYGGGAGHAHKHFPAEHLGYMNRLVSTQNYSAVTAACLLIKRDDFWAVDGLDEKNLTVAFNDVDLCLKVLQLGRRNLYCAEALLYHHESVSRGYEDTPVKARRFQKEVSHLQTKWKYFIKYDPCYNKSLTLKKENFEIKT